MGTKIKLWILLKTELNYWILQELRRDIKFIETKSNLKFYKN